MLLMNNKYTYLSENSSGWQWYFLINEYHIFASDHLQKFVNNSKMTEVQIQISMWAYKVFCSNFDKNWRKSQAEVVSCCANIIIATFTKHLNVKAKRKTTWNVNPYEHKSVQYVTHAWALTTDKSIRNKILQSNITRIKLECSQSVIQSVSQVTH